MRLLIRWLGLSFELWSPAEEKVGFSSTVSDRLVKRKKKKVGNWEKPGQWLRPKGLYLCAGVRRRRRPRGYDTMRSYFFFSLPSGFLLSPPVQKPKSHFFFGICPRWKLPSMRNWGHVLESLRGLSQGSTVPEEIHSRTSREQWRRHGITKRYEKALTRRWGSALMLRQGQFLSGSSRTIPPHPPLPFSADVLWNPKQSGQGPHLGFLP